MIVAGMSSFQLLNQSLEKCDLKTNLIAEAAGAFVSFEGFVRNHNDGKKVLALEYEAVDALCQSEAKKIFMEAHSQFDIIELKCAHRIGKLSVGEMAVWVGVLAAHRDSAFKACRYLIDEIKNRLPIWKKEYYADGESMWVNGSSSSHQ